MFVFSISDTCNFRVKKENKGEQLKCEDNYECIKKGSEQGQGSILFEAIESSLKEITTIVVLMAVAAFFVMKWLKYLFIYLKF